jgi:protein associated with RNAse G/E
VYIQSFKHDGSLHRTWAKGFVIEANEEQIVAITNKALVTESNKRKWVTKEPAICFFYSKRWYNIISMIRKNGIYYYCNLASPSFYDGEAIKNIDYDLDVKLFPTGKYTILDEDEWDQHSQIMAYPQEIKDIVESQMQELIERIVRFDSPFNEDNVNMYYRKYLSILDDQYAKETESSIEG